MLLFKKRFLDAIRSGRKTQTIRLWRHRKMRAGQRSYIPGAGYIRIDAVEEVQLADLTDDDARPDGFPTRGGIARGDCLRCIRRSWPPGIGRSALSSTSSRRKSR